MKKFITIIVIIFLIIILTFIIYSKNVRYSNININMSQNDIVNEKEQKFLLYIDDICTDVNGTFIMGNVSNGSLNVEDKVSIVGLGNKSVDSMVEKIYIDDKECNSATLGDNIKVKLKIEVDNKIIIEKGQAMIIDGTMKPIFNLKVKIEDSKFSIEEIKERGKKICINKDIECSNISVLSLEEKEIKVCLSKPIVIEKGIKLSIKDEGKVIAEGTIIND